MKIINEKEYSDALSILKGTGLPLVYSKETEPTPFLGGMWILLHTNNKGEVIKIEECRGYHRRELIVSEGGTYHILNDLSAYAEGAFQSRQDVSNAYENHPLLKMCYNREIQQKPSSWL